MGQNVLCLSKDESREDKIPSHISLSRADSRNKLFPGRNPVFDGGGGELTLGLVCSDDSLPLMTVVSD